MAECSPKGQKTPWEKEKLLVTSNFSFSHSLFKRLVLQTRKDEGLTGKGLNVSPNTSYYIPELYLIMFYILCIYQYFCLNLPCSGKRGGVNSIYMQASHSYTRISIHKIQFRNLFSNDKFKTLPK